MVKFYDTNYLIELGSNIFDNLGTKDKVVTSSVCLMEMEHIKTSKNKDDSVKYKTRKATHALDGNLDTIDVVVYDEKIEKYIIEKGLIPDKPDIQICACAAYLRDEYDLDDLVFYTRDLSCKVIAKKVFGLNIDDDSNKAEEKYTGFKEIVMSDEDMAYFYEHQEENIYGLLINEYLIIKNNNSEVVDTLRWDGIEYQQLTKRNIESMYFTKIKPKDIYQQCTIDSLLNCTITAVSGKAGSGKSLLTLMAAMYLIEKGKYDKLVILFNPTKTRGASDMGFYGGTASEKARQNSIGNILTTKFGDEFAIDLLESQNKLKLVSMADCRGMEIRDNEILWITESQNTSIDLIKLCLSRVSSGAKVFIEGDYLSQVDSYFFENENNGLHRMIEVFKGHAEFGYIELQNVWRSKIAELCELL